MREVRAAAQAAALAAVAAAAAAAARRAGQQLWELACPQHAQQEGRQPLGLEARAQSSLRTPPLPPSRGLTRGQWRYVWEGGWGSRHASKRAVLCAPVLLPPGLCRANPAAVQALLPCPLTGTLLRHSSRSTHARQHMWVLIGVLVALAEAPAVPLMCGPHPAHTQPRSACKLSCRSLQLLKHSHAPGRQ